MRARITPVLAATAAVMLAVGGVHADKPSEQDPNQCAHVRGKPVFQGDGFSHVVSIRNTCTRIVHCHVWTNVDEGHKERIEVPAHQERKAILQDDSPVSLFRAEGRCKFQRKRKRRRRK